MRTITVEGNGKSVRKPDLAILEISVSKFEEEVEEGLYSMNELMNKLKDSLKKIGLNEDDLKTTSFRIDPEYNSVEKGIINKEYSNKFTGYFIQHEMKLEFYFNNKKLSEVLNCLKDYDEHLKFELSFAVKDKKEMTKEVLKNATKDAEFKAEILAESSSVKLGNLININCEMYDFYFKSNTKFTHRSSVSIRSIFESSRIIPEEIELSDTIVFVWEII